MDIWPEWPTFPSGLCGDWQSADHHTDVMNYRSPNRLILLMMKNKILLETYEDMMRRLTPKQAEAVELRQEGRTQEQIGDELGVSQPAVNKHLRLAGNKL
jgi:DNA-directed RNA polymerase specialized sigma24 family protein